MGASSTKFRLFVHKISFIINTLFPPSYEMLYAGQVELKAEASELLTHAVFQLIVVRKMAFLGCILHRAKKMEVGGC
jgi:hypothetical protein